jgi:putative ABC transport system permease protein
MYISLALKNTFRQKKRSFTLGLNYTVVAIILLLVFAFTNGAKANVTDNLIKTSAGHLTIAGQYVSERKAFLGVKNYPLVTDIVHDTLGSDSLVLPRYILSSTLYYKGVSKRLQFTGIDTALDTSFNDQLILEQGVWEDFSGNPNAIIIPQEAADYFGFNLNDEVLISTRTRFGAFNTGLLKITGIHNAANFFAAGVILCHLTYLQELDLAQRDTAITLYIYLPTLAELDAKRDRLVNALAAAGFEVYKPQSNEEAISAITGSSARYTIEETDKDIIRLTVFTLDEALGIVSTVLGAVNGFGIFIAAILFFIIAVSIFINLRMTINERLKEIGTMRTLGVEKSGVTLLFILENVVLALLFTCLGLAAGLGIIALLRFVIKLPSAGALSLVLADGHLTLLPSMVDMAVILAVITLATALFSFFPARFGGRIKPADALNNVF